ncbi:hypothetical protein Bcep18194_C7482 [Burkholderia lata]|uniref:Uncharacterized protein n=1 Tax=Burkholderia lata (strain ATCC 17760 / DSM 23089 / LMG 22485 / NCIMB 9086 / R18194 / 383) TaxID=482957 RepID=Q39LZ0_BURL3|nr:hypothetical protein Bcep18194_C7482 [Burkholderia lata]
MKRGAAVACVEAVAHSHRPGRRHRACTHALHNRFDGHQPREAGRHSPPVGVIEPRDCIGRPVHIDAILAASSSACVACRRAIERSIPDSEYFRTSKAPTLAPPVRHRVNPHAAAGFAALESTLRKRSIGLPLTCSYPVRHESDSLESGGQAAASDIGFP